MQRPLMDERRWIGQQRFLFALPGAVTLLALPRSTWRFGDTALVEAVFAGLAPAVVAVVVQALRTLIVGLLLWAAPVLAAAALLGRSSVLVDQGLFFSGAAVVTFRGAYAVLAFVMVVQFVAFHFELPRLESLRVSAVAVTLLRLGPLYARG